MSDKTLPNRRSAAAHAMHDKMTPEQRAAHTTPAREALVRKAAQRKLREAVDRVVESAPELTPEQLDRIGALLRGPSQRAKAAG